MNKIKFLAQLLFVSVYAMCTTGSLFSVSISSLSFNSASPAGTVYFGWKPISNPTNSLSLTFVSNVSSTSGGQLDIGIGFVPTGTTPTTGATSPIKYISLIVGGWGNTKSQISYYEASVTTYYLQPSTLTTMPTGTPTSVSSGGTAVITRDAPITYVLTLANGTLSLVGINSSGVATTILKYSSSALQDKIFTFYSFKNVNTITDDAAICLPSTAITSASYATPVAGYYPLSSTIAFPWKVVAGQTTSTNSLQLSFSATVASGDLGIGIGYVASGSTAGTAPPTAFIDLVVGGVNSAASSIGFSDQSYSTAALTAGAVSGGTARVTLGAVINYALTITNGTLTLVGTDTSGVATTILNYMSPALLSKNFTFYSFRTTGGTTFPQAIAVTGDSASASVAAPGMVTSCVYGAANPVGSNFFGWKQVASPSNGIRLTFTSTTFGGDLGIGIGYVPTGTTPSTGAAAPPAFIDLSVGGWSNKHSLLAFPSGGGESAWLSYDTPPCIPLEVPVNYTLTIANATMSLVSVDPSGVKKTVFSYSSPDLLNKTFISYSFRSANVIPLKQFTRITQDTATALSDTGKVVASIDYNFAAPAGTTPFGWKPITAMNNSLKLTFSAFTVGGQMNIGLGYVPLESVAPDSSSPPRTYMDIVVGCWGNAYSYIASSDGKIPAIWLNLNTPPCISLGVPVNYTLTIGNGTLSLVGVEASGAQKTIFNYSGPELQNKRFTFYSFRTSNQDVITQYSIISNDVATPSMILPPGSYTSNDFATAVSGYFSAAATNFFGWKPIPTEVQGNSIQLSFTAFTPLTNLTVGLRSGTNSVVALYIGGWFNAQSAIADFPNGTASPPLSLDGNSDAYQYIYPGGSNGPAVFPTEPTKYTMTISNGTVRIMGAPVSGGASKLVLFYSSPSLNKVFNAYSFCTWNAPGYFNYITVTDDSVAAATSDTVITSQSYDSSVSSVINPSAFYGWKSLSAPSNCFSLSFNAFTESDLHLGLKYNNGASYLEFNIGGWGNTRSAFRVFNNGQQVGGDIYIQPSVAGKVLPDTTNYVSYVATVGVNPATNKGFLSISGTTLANVVSQVFYYESTALNQQFSGYSFKTWSASNYHNSLYLSNVAATVDVAANTAVALNSALTTARSVIDPVVVSVNAATSALQAARQVYKTIATYVPGATLPF